MHMLNTAKLIENLLSILQLPQRKTDTDLRMVHPVHHISLMSLKNSQPLLDNKPEETGISYDVSFPQPPGFNHQPA